MPGCLEKSFSHGSFLGGFDGYLMGISWGFDGIFYHFTHDQSDLMGPITLIEKEVIGIGALMGIS